MRFGQVKQLLLALHQAYAGESARSHRDQRLQQLEAMPLRVQGGIEERQHAIVAIRNAHDEQIDDGKRSESGSNDILGVEASDVEHGHGDNENLHGRAEVWLDDDQPNQGEHRSQRGKDGAFPVVYSKALGLAAPLEEPSKIENHGELGEFGGLQAGRTQANPAMGRMRLVEEKSSYEHHEHYEQTSKNDLWPPEVAVVHVHHQPHSADAQHQPDNLVEKKMIAATEFVARR